MATWVEKSELRAQILELRARGLKTWQIAERLGYAHGYVRNYLCGKGKQYADQQKHLSHAMPLSR